MRFERGLGVDVMLSSTLAAANNLPSLILSRNFLQPSAAPSCAPPPPARIIRMYTYVYTSQKNMLKNIVHRLYNV